MNLYTLNDGERLALSLAGDQNVIAAGPWRRDAGELANRVVLRSMHAEFTVHRQCIMAAEDGERSSVSFCWGYYFGYRMNPSRADEALGEAWLCFEGKVREHQGIPERTRAETESCQEN